LFQLHSETIWSVNKLGTENVIQACKKFGVQALIFTSTVNVVYGGQRIESGEESMPYFDVKKVCVPFLTLPTGPESGY